MKKIPLLLFAVLTMSLTSCSDDQNLDTNSAQTTSGVNLKSDKLTDEEIASLKGQMLQNEH